MKALVIYESIFGNTRDIGESIARGLEERFEVEIAEISEAHGDPEQVDLLVIGGPTHVLSMSKDSSRADARKKAAEKGIEPVSKREGIRELLESLADGASGPLVATFDTSVKKRWIPLGSAAKSASKQLEKRGFEMVMDAEQFRVDGTEGPLHPGELERAEMWGRELGADAAGKLGAGQPAEVN